MKTAVIVFPGSNCDRDAQMALRQVSGSEPAMVWHKDGELPKGLDRAMLAEVSSAMLFSRAFVTGESLDDAFLTDLVDRVLLPLVQHRAGDA